MKPGRRGFPGAIPFLLTAMVLAACGGSPATRASTHTTSPTSRTSTTKVTAPVGAATTTTTAKATGPVQASDDGLMFEVTDEPAHGPVTAPVMFTITATATHATGALHYVVSFGDGSQAADAVPEFCLAGPGKTTSETWTLPHTYAAAGSYKVSVTVAVNCSSATATAMLAVSPTPK